MSWWVYLVEDVEEFESDDYERAVCQVKSHSEGGTYAMGGIGRAELNITYNYSPYYYEHLHPEGLRGLDNQRAKDVTANLEEAIKALGTEQDEDYWASTEGNAGYALSILLAWAKQYPDGIFVVH